MLWTILITLAYILAVSALGILANQYRLHRKAISRVRDIPGLDYFHLLVCLLFHKDELVFIATPKEIERQCLRFTKKVDSGVHKTSHAGMWRMTLGDKNMLLTADPKLCKEILTMRGFDKLPEYRAQVVSNKPHLFSSLTDDYWQRCRRVASPAFSDKSMSELVDKWMHSLSDRIVQKWELAHETKGSILELSDDCGKHALDVMSIAGFGEEINSLEMPNVESTMEGIHGNDVTDWLSKVFYVHEHLAILPEWLIQVPVPYFNRMRDAVKNYKMFLRKLIERRRRHDTAAEPDDDEVNLLYRIIHGHEKVGGEPLTDDELMANVLALHAGGSHTSANTLAYCLHFLSCLPDVQDRVYREVEVAHQTHGEHLSLEVLEKELPFLNNTIKETLRLKGTAHIVDRWVMRKTSLLGSDGVTYELPKHASVSLALCLLHRDKKIWGEDADQFRPERFSKMSDADQRNYFMPFGSGVRVCIGKRFAICSLMVSVSKILRRFKLRSTAEPHIIANPVLLQDKVEFTLAPAHPLHVELTRRQ